METDIPAVNMEPIYRYEIWGFCSRECKTGPLKPKEYNSALVTDYIIKLLKNFFL